MALDDPPTRRGRHRLRSATQWTMTAAVVRGGLLARWRRRWGHARRARPRPGGRP